MAIGQLFKDLLAIGRAINNFELNKKLMELQQELMQFQEENRTLKDRVRELEDQRDRDGDVKWENDAYWEQKGTVWDGPFCSGCYDNERRLIRLTKLEDAFQAIATHQCPVCRHTCSPQVPG